MWKSRGFYSSVVLASVPWLRRCFLVGERLFISRILRNPFLVGVFLIRAKCGAQDISLYTLCVRTTQETWLTRQLHPVNLSFHDTSFWSSLTHALMTFSCSRHPQYGLSPFGVSHENVSKVVSYFRVVSYYRVVNYYLGFRNYIYHHLTKHFFDFKNTRKMFFLYIPKKQNFENRKKKKMLQNIT